VTVIPNSTHNKVTTLLLFSSSSPDHPVTVIPNSTHNKVTTLLLISSSSPDHPVTVIPNSTHNTVTTLLQELPHVGFRYIVLAFYINCKLQGS